MQEVWKDIVGYEGLYKISNEGRVKSLKRIDSNNHLHKERILSPCLRHNAYYWVHLSKNGKYEHFSIHKLVAEHFVPGYFEGAVVNHINEIKTDNRADNLEWCTPEYNTRYSCCKAVRCIETGEVFPSGRDASRFYGLSDSGVSSAIKRNCKAGGYHWEYAEL